MRAVCFFWQFSLCNIPKPSCRGSQKGGFLRGSRPGRHECHRFRWIFEMPNILLGIGFVAANPLFFWGGIQKRTSLVFGMSQLAVEFFKAHWMISRIAHFGWFSHATCMFKTYLVLCLFCKEKINHTKKRHVSLPKQIVHPHVFSLSEQQASRDILLDMIIPQFNA